MEKSKMKSKKNNSIPESKPNTLNKWCVSLLSLGLMSGSVLAGSNSTTLPNNAVCGVTIDSPLTGTQFSLPTGETTIDIPVNGSAGITEGDPLIASFIYVLDVSGSTAEGGGTGCTPILNCEKQFLKALNQEIITQGVSNEVGMAVYAEIAKVADMTPTTGVQKIITPNAGNSTYPSFLNTVVDSTISYTGSTSSKITKFTTYNNLGRWTNCKDGLVKGLEVAQATNINNPRIMVFTSDGICNRGTQAEFDAAVQAIANAGVIAHSVAIGTESSCTTNQGSGSLAQIAQGTGGQCFHVPDPGNLPAIIPSFVGSALDSLDLQVDGGIPIPISNSGIIPPLPESAPITVTYTTLAQSLAAGSHEICVTANCSAPQGAGSATQCETIQIDAAVNHPPVAVDDSYTTDEDVLVSGNVLSNDTDPDSDPLTVTANTNPSNGTLSGINPDGSFTYTPNANFCGTDTFTYTVSDGRTPPLTDIGTVTINVTCVNDPPVAANNDDYTTDENVPLTISAPGILDNDTDPDGDVLTVVIPTASQPNHGTLTQNPDGSFTYVPESGFCVGENYTDSYSYYAQDPAGAQSNLATVVISVTCVNDPPVANPDSYTVNEDEILTVPTNGVLGNDTDLDNDPLTVAGPPPIITPPTNGTATLNADGSFSYEPNDNFCGEDSYTYKAFDGQVMSNNPATVTITVTCINDPPVATNDSYTTDEDVILTVPAAGVLVNDNDGGDGGPLTIVSYTQPSQGGTVVLNQSDGSFVYTPAANFNGIVSFNYTISDGQAESTATVTITVTGINDPPVAEDDNYTTGEDQPLTIAAPGILANDHDPDTDPLIPTDHTNPSNGTLTLNPDGSFTYTPNANFSGTDSFTYTVSDPGGLSDTATVTIIVNGENDPPVATGDNYITDEDVTLTVPAATGVLVNDNDGGDGGPLTIPSYTQPNNGTVTLNQDGSFIYVPAANFNGVDSFTYTISDGQDTSTTIVTITVNPVNDPPVAVNDNYTTGEDQPLTVPTTGVLVNDNDGGDGGPLSVTSNSQPSNGTVAQNADGSFTYTPNANFAGTDSYTYTISDGQGTSTATVTITINGENDPPVANSDSYTTNEDVTLTVPAATGVLANDNDGGDGGPLTIPSYDPQSIQGGTVTLNPDGSFTYVPAANFNGIDSFTYTISDGQGTSTTTVTITVNPINDPPVAVDDNYTTGEDQSLTVPAATGVLVNDNDGGDGGALIVSPPYTQPSNGTVTLNPDGSFVYTPNPNFYGTDSFTYKNSDSVDTSNTATVTIIVNKIDGNSPIANPDSYTTNEDEPLTVPVPGVLGNDTDPDNDPLTVVSNTQPGNGTVSQNPDGSFTYTPNLNFHGTDSFTYTISDGINTSTTTVTITVLAVNDPLVANPDNYSTDETQPPLTIPAPGVLGNDTDVDGDPLTVVSNTSPTRGTVTVNPDGSLTYNPAACSAGEESYTASFNYTASDGQVTDDTTVTITVACINGAPEANDDPVTTNEDTPVVIDVLTNDTDPDGDPLTVTIGSGPNNGTLTPGPGNSFTYTPNPNFCGTDSFTYTATDSGGLSDTATVTINVACINDAPVANPDSYPTNENQPLTIPAPGVLGNDTDVDGDPLTVVSNTPPTRGTVTVNQDGSLTYNPAACSAGEESYTASFNYTASDGQVTDDTTVTITVACINGAPEANDDPVTTNEDTPVVINVLANDTDPDGDPLTVTIGSGPNNGTLTPGPGNSFTYTPNPNYCGTDSFTYTVTDPGGLSDTATVIINVACINDAPVAVDDNYTTNEDQTLTISVPGVLGNDTDVDGTALSVVNNTQPGHGTVTLNSNGSFTYTPNANYCGPDSFNYTASDGQLTDSATVTINVTCINDPPLAVPDNYSIGQGQTLTVPVPGVLANDTDADLPNDTLTAAVTIPPSYGTLTLNPNGFFTYKPQAQFFGTDIYTYTITDQAGATSTTTVTIQVICLNTAPTAVDDNYTVNEDTTLTVVVPGVLTNDSNNGVGTLKVVANTSPGHGTLTQGVGGRVVYKPNANFHGTDSYTYTISNSQGVSTATVTINVTSVNDPPKAVNDSYVVFKNQPLLIAAPGVLINDTDAEGDLLTVISNTAPNRGTVTLNADGSFVYAPKVNYVGNASFKYTISDGQGGTATGTVNFVVQCQPCPTCVCP
jgi:large repetitive protein